MPEHAPAEAPLACGTVLFQDGRGTPHLSVIVKATFTLGEGELALLAPPLALTGDERRPGEAAGSLHAASDFAPCKLRADVVVVGRVHPRHPGATTQVVGLALARGQEILLSKRLVAVGDRPRLDAAPLRLSEQALGWERSWGGASSAENPVGTGLAEGSRPPSLLDPDRPRHPAGLGPIAPGWSGRAAFLPEAHASALRTAPPTLPADLDLRFFQIAPPDQQLPHLLGGEQILLIGLHPRGTRTLWRLPALHAFAHLAGPFGGRSSPRGHRPRAVPLAGDTLWIDAERGLACVTYRGSVEVGKRAEMAAILSSAEPWSVRAGMAPCDKVEETLGSPRAWSRPAHHEATVDPGDAPAGSRAPSPTVDPVSLHDESGFTAGCLRWSFEPPKPRRIIIVKGTFALLAEGGIAALAPEQQPLRSDEPASDDPRAALAYASDYAPFKARADVLLLGTAHAAPGRTTALVRVELGALVARLVALGPRVWEGQSPGPPGPFEPVPLRYEHAFGGPGVDANPAGTGAAPGSAPPRLEHPARLLRARSDRLPPACFAPIAPSWPARRALLGTYDRAWKRERWPYFPADFDPAFFQAAPEALRTDLLRGDEPFVLESVRPGGARLTGALPGLRPRAFAVRRGGEAFEVLLRLDTVVFDSDALRVSLTWRGSFELEATAIERVALFREALGAPRAPAEVAAWLAALEEPRLAPAAEASAVEPHTAAPSFRLDDHLHLIARGAGVAGGLFAARAASAVRAPPEPPPPETRARVEALVRAGESLRGRDLTGADLRGIDLSGQDLRGAILSRARLEGARFARAGLAGARLSRVEAADTCWDEADLARADLTGATLTRASFAKARLVGASLVGAALREGLLDEVEAGGADLSRADLTRCRASRASFAKADFSRATLTDASFPRSRFDDAKLYEVAATSACFEEAELPDARFEKAKLAGASFRGARAGGAVWESADLSGADLRGADLHGAIFSGAQLTRADLGGALAIAAVFRAADLTTATLDGADLRQASFEGASLRGASLRGTSLYQAETQGATLEGADLTRAFVAGTKLAT
jgi:uncharacterized protein YjbI with pentapeptide repeats